MKYIMIALGFFGLDGMVKNKMEQRELHTDQPFCRKLLLLRKYYNRGAFLNTGETHPKLVKLLSVLLSLLMTILFAVTLTKTGKGLLKLGLSLILGGAYSNTYDRMKRGYVVDYVSFNVPWRWLRQIVFNISDFCIMIGAMLCVLGYDK